MIFSIFRNRFLNFLRLQRAIKVEPISEQTFHKPFGLFYYRDKLYWEDYLRHSIFEYGLTTKRITQGEFAVVLGAKPWYVIPYENDPADFNVNNGVTNYKVRWETKDPAPDIVRPIFSVEIGPIYVNRTLAFAKVAPNCDLVFGTLGSKLCADDWISGTYTYNKESGVTKMISNQIEAGEVAWNDDGTKMYQINPCGNVVREYNYDAKTGDICNKMTANFVEMIKTFSPCRKIYV